jgi:hypothetical protein
VGDAPPEAPGLGGHPGASLYRPLTVVKGRHEGLDVPLPTADSGGAAGRGPGMI